MSNVDRPVDKTAFRQAAGQFASGIVVATTSLDGVSHAMTATAFTAVSLEPLLDDALAAMECRTTAVHDGGDHSIVVGEVVGVSELRPGGGPLIHYASRYRRLRDS